MATPQHDPREHIRGLHQLLISGKKRIGFLFGAGTSFATGIEVYIPAVAEMTEVVVSEVEKVSKSLHAGIMGMKLEIEANGSAFHIESLLSTVEAKRSVVGGGKLNGLNKVQLTELSNELKRQIKAIVLAHESLKPELIKHLAHCKLAGWLSRATRRFPVEIFTTNYDYLLELALENHSIPYFDGFSGSFKPFFCPEAIEDIRAYPDLVKLWKLHGSLNWQYSVEKECVLRSENTPAESMLIFPSHLKYDTTKKQPYVGLIDRLYTFLQQDDAVLITCGFSFGDNHINERIATSLRRGGNSHVVAMYFDEYRDKKGQYCYGLNDPLNAVRKMAIVETAGKMSVFGRRHAVIGAKFGEWRLKSEPSREDSIAIDSYYDEDAALPEDKEGEQKGSESWSGLGNLSLPDFRKLATFLSNISGEQ